MGDVLTFVPRQVSGVSGPGRHYYIIAAIAGEPRIFCAGVPRDFLTLPEAQQMLARANIQCDLWQSLVARINGREHLKLLGGGYFVLGDEKIRIGGTSPWGIESDRAQTLAILERCFPGRRAEIEST